MKEVFCFNDEMICVLYIFMAKLKFNSNGL